MPACGTARTAKEPSAYIKASVMLNYRAAPNSTCARPLLQFAPEDTQKASLLALLRDHQPPWNEQDMRCDAPKPLF